MATIELTAIDNPYWDAVKDHVGPDPFFTGRPLCVDWLSNHAHDFPVRTDYVRRYAWTITDPTTVEFIAEHSRGRLIDPLAGTGYWGYILDQAGIDVASYDLHPPDGSDRNGYHKGATTFGPVLQGDAVDVVTVHADRTLLLSWPPYEEPLGARILSAYAGDRVIYIGEGDGGCCGSDAMFATLAREWTKVAEHGPIQWSGMHDYVTVYDRSTRLLGGTR